MIYAGTIIEINNNKTYVFTMDYSVVTLRTKKDYFLGQQVTFSKKDKYKDLYLLGGDTLKAFALAAAAVILVTALALSGVFNQFTRGRSFDEICTALVSVDINPSIEISINKDEMIVEAKAKNEDGVKVLETLDLKEKNLLDGVNEIVTAAKSMGYIDVNKNAVLVSAALYDTILENDSEDYSKQLKEILSTLEASGEATVLTVFIDDSKIIEEAENNNLSIGKELLFQYAKSQEDALTADDIRAASLSDLLDKLNALEQDGKLVDTIKNPETVQSDYEVTPVPDITATPMETDQTEATVPTQIPIEEPIPSEVPEPGKEESEISETQEAEPTATPKPTEVPEQKEEVESFVPNLKVSTDGATIDFSWTALASSTVTYKDKTYRGFLYYKVVASATNKHPIYPEDGYLTVISDKSDNEWSVNPAEGDYNYSPELYSGETYYFSITYVFENGKFTSDTETLQVPAFASDIPDETADSFQLSISAGEDSLTFHWTPLNSNSVTYDGKTYKDFSFYKVVASQTNPNPKYPDDGYLTYISDCYEDSWTVYPSDGDYNYSPKLLSGETYYFSITYVFGNGKLYSNTIQYTVP